MIYLFNDADAPPPTNKKAPDRSEASQSKTSGRA